MIDRVTRICSYFAGAALLAMAFLGISDIIGIHLFASPVPGVVEITSSLMVASIFLGLPITEARGQNVRVEVLVQNAPASIRRVLAVASRISMAALFGMIAWFGFESLVRSIETNAYAEGLIRVPYWPARLSLVIGAVLVVLQALSAALREFRTGEIKQASAITWKV